MKQINFKTILAAIFMSLLFSNSYGISSGNPFFLTEADNIYFLRDARLTALTYTGFIFAVTAGLLKLIVESRKEFCEKNNISNTKSSILNFCKKMIPSTNSVFLIAGLLLMTSSKSILNFFDACFKAWAVGQSKMYHDNNLNLDDKNFGLSGFNPHPLLSTNRN